MSGAMPPSNTSKRCGDVGGVAGIGWREKPMGAAAGLPALTHDHLVKWSCQVAQLHLVEERC